MKTILFTLGLVGCVAMLLMVAAAKLNDLTDRLTACEDEINKLFRKLYRMQMLLNDIKDETPRPSA